MSAHADQLDCTEEDDHTEREQDNGSSAFLKLPAEIRNHIYAELLPSDEVWHITTESYYEIRPSNSKPDKKAYVKHERPDDMSFDDRLALSRCCKQLREEVHRFYYGFNAFVLPVSPEDMDKSNKWLSTRPREAFAVMRKVYLQQTMRRCHRYRVPGYDRLLSIDLKTLEVVIIGKLRHCSGCLDRYEKQIERLKERRSYKKLKAKWSASDLSSDRLMELARVFQRRSTSDKSDEDEDKALEGLMLLFEGSLAS